MRRFFFKPEEKAGNLVVLSTTESHHIRRVLRLPVGAEVELFDGSGGIYQAKLVEIGQKVRARIVSANIEPEEDGVPLWVGQGLLKAKNMDMVVQKCTELGVRGLIPFLSSRCQGRPDLTKESKKHERWLKIVEESCKQCRRSRPMEMSEAMDFQKLLCHFNSMSSGLNILFWEEEEEVGLHDFAPFQDVGEIRILLGPEGGFTREEAEMARKAGWRTVSLGRRILRAETAVLASVAVLQYLLGTI